MKHPVQSTNNPNHLFAPGTDLQPVYVCDGQRYSGPVPAVRTEDVPGAAAPGEVCQELPGDQENSGY